MNDVRPFDSAPPATPSSAREPGPMRLFDAHTHLDVMAIRAGLAADDAYVRHAIADAREAGVVAAVTVGCDVPSSRWAVEAARAHAEIYATVAAHPTEIRGLTDDDYSVFEELARLPEVVAVGETGLDYFHADTTPQEQDRHFRRHIELAKAVGKPLMIHDREAHADVLRILREQGAPEQVIFHSFSGDEQMARECAAAGYVMSFSGVVTFKNAPAVRAAAAVVPLELLLVETDAPFLTPHPHRGTPNAPRLLPLTARALADAVGVEAERLAAATLANGRRVLGLPGLPATSADL